MEDPLLASACPGDGLDSAGHVWPTRCPPPAGDLGNSRSYGYPVRSRPAPAPRRPCGGAGGRGAAREVAAAGNRLVGAGRARGDDLLRLPRLFPARARGADPVPVSTSTCCSAAGAGELPESSSVCFLT